MQSFPTGNSNVTCIRAPSYGAPPALAAGAARALVSDDIRLESIAPVSELEQETMGMNRPTTSAVLAVHRPVTNSALAITGEHHIIRGQAAP